MSSSSPDSAHDPHPDELVDWPQKATWHSRTRLIIDKTRQFVAANLGLLLVVAAQGFFSIMNVFVKQLSDIDTPVSTFEVSAGELFFFEFLLILGFLGH